MFRNLATSLDAVSALHQHLRFYDRDQSGLLAQCRIAGQRMSVGFDASATGRAIADGKDRSPLGEARAHLHVLSQTRAQSIQPFGNLLAGAGGHRLRTYVHLDPGNDPLIGESFGEWRAIVRFAKARRGYDQLAILPPRLLGLWDGPFSKSFVAGPGALVDGNQSFAVGDHLLRG